MANDERMIAIAIGVADSVPSKYLAGAINGARAFEQWAFAQGYETVLVTDETEGVTINALRDRIQHLLIASPKPIHRIIVYFAGHGLIREVEEGLWLLSDWRTDLRAVAVEVLKRRLSMYGPRQVCIISDACRSLPRDVEQADLVPDAVLGSGPKPVDMSIAIDKFIAAQDGTEAFCIPGKDPEDDRCLFSGVLIEGLWGITGLHERPFSKLLPNKVTSRSLGAYLLAEVPARAQEYGLTLTPTVSPTFPEGDDYYFSNDPPVAPPELATWPPKTKSSGRESTDRATFSLGYTDFEFGSFSGAAPASSAAGDSGPANSHEPAPSTRSLRLLKRLRNIVLSGLQDGSISSGVAVSGNAPVRLWLPPGIIASKLGALAGWSIGRADHTPLSAPVPTLIEFHDGRVAATVALPRLFASLVRDDHGICSTVYRDLTMPLELAGPTEQALAALEAGALRAEAATDLAARLRCGKHLDPVLGVISAYLYDAIGDIDSIRRMASFYAQCGEFVPYDIALLAGLHGYRHNNGFVVEIPEVAQREPRTQREGEHSWTYCHMAATSGMVGGLWPWMRQGWIFLDDPVDAGSPLILSGLVGLRAGLTRSRFATLERDAALALAEICGLQPREND